MQPSWRQVLLPFAILAVVIWFLFLRDGATDSQPPASTTRSAQSYAAEFGGGAGRYEVVLELTDCAALGRMFSAGKANFDANAVGLRDQWRGQMEVTSDRMDALGCP